MYLKYKMTSVPIYTENDAIIAKASDAFHVTCIDIFGPRRTGHD